MLDLQYSMNPGGEASETIIKDIHTPYHFHRPGFTAPSKSYPVYRILRSQPRAEDERGSFFLRSGQSTSDSIR